MWVRPRVILPHEDPGDLHGYCGGKDLSLRDKCSCPDPLFLLQIRISTGETYHRGIKCACCNLPIDGRALP